MIYSIFDINPSDSLPVLLKLVDEKNKKWIVIDCKDKEITFRDGSSFMPSDFEKFVGGCQLRRIEFSSDASAKLYYQLNY